MDKRRQISGTMWSLASALLWATTFVCARYLLAGGRVDPISLSMIRFVLGAAVLGIYALITVGDRLRAITLGDGLRLATLGLLGVVAMSVLLFVGQRTTTAINSALIMQSNPVLIALLGLLIGERLGWLQGMGIVISLFGCLLVVRVIGPDGFGYDPAHWRGDVCVALAALSWAIYSVAGKPMVQRHGGLVTSTWAMVFGAVELVLIWLLLPRWTAIEIIWPVGLNTWAIIGYLAAGPTAVAFLAWYKAMNRIPLALLNVMQYLTPGFAIVLAWLLLGERITAANALGLGLILAGVTITALPSRRSRLPAR